MGETYYDVLGVDPDATRAEIRVAYRERVLETHPDQSDDPDAADRFALVSEAESVLTDETERARYDRLGHRAYQRWGDEFPAASANAADASAASGRTHAAKDSDSDSPDEPRDGPRDDGGVGSSDDGRDRARAGARGRRRSTGSSRGTRSGPRRRSSGPTGSHHARQRYRRRAATATAADWGFGEDGTGSTASADDRGGSATANANADATADAGRGTATDPGSVAGSATGPRQGGTVGFGVDDAGAGSDGAATGAEDDAAADGFAVHAWTGDVDVDSPFQPLTRRSAFFLGCIWALYPLLVYSSLSPAFPLVVNAVVGACTVALVGYLLTWPRVAMAAFGVWSAVAPVVIFPAFGLAALSLYGGLVWGAFWVPFALAATVWLTLRP